MKSRGESTHGCETSQYLRELFVVSEDCDFGELKKERIRDQFLVGISDDKLAEKLEHLYLTNTDKFDLEFVTEYMRSYCDVKDGRKMRCQMEEVNAVRSDKQTDKHKFGNCGYCGLEHEKRRCPAYGKACRECGKNNHFAKMCRQKKRRDVQEVQEAEVAVVASQSSMPVDVGQDYYFLGKCTSNHSNSNDNSGMVEIYLNAHRMKFKVDTGADVNVLNFDSYKIISPTPVLLKPDLTLVTPSGNLNILGVAILDLDYKGKHFKDKFYVLTKGNLTNNLLSRSTSIDCGIVKFINDVRISDDIFGFGQWQTDPVKFTFKDNVVPHCVNAARRVAIPLLDPVRNTLNCMEENDVIEKVTEPTEWLSGMVPVVKKDGEKLKVRITVDYKHLNKALKREKFQIPTFEEISYKLANATVFSKLDAASGFFQIPLCESARNFTAFITPMGRYRFKRCPQGINIAPEIYQRKMTELLGGLDGVIIYMDDIVVFGVDGHTHDKNLTAVLERIKAAGLKLNKEKCIFSTDEVQFLGHLINKDGIKICPERVNAIKEMRTPESVKDLQRLLGMINFVTKFVPMAQTILVPMYELLKKDVVWIWGPAQEKAFSDVKELLSRAPTLAHFDPGKPTVVSADASPYGLGGVLLQSHNGVLRPVAFCSRTLTSAERRYAHIEKECLAPVFACEHFHVYLCGLEFKLQTDHKPLVPIINSKELNEAPLRCQRMLMRLARYSPQAVYVPGKFMVVADTLSRNIESVTKNKEKVLINEIDAFSHGLMSCIPATSKMMSKISLAQSRDPLLSRVMNFTRDGWGVGHVTGDLMDYFAARGDLSMYNGNILIYRNRLVIPLEMRSEMLQKLHEGHLSLHKCRERLQESVWWPGASIALKNYLDRCSFCQLNRRKNKSQPISSSVLPERPWMKIGADLFELNNKVYLVVVDYFSRWLEVKLLLSVDSESVINNLAEIFACFGIPEVLRTDGGPQFKSKLFYKFTEDFNIIHQMTDPYFPQANGCAERAVQVAKRLFKTPDPLRALMEYRGTPIATTGCSPAQLLMGRRIRTNLPTVPSRLTPKWPDLDTVRRRDAEAKLKMEAGFNRRQGARPLSGLSIGQEARVRLPQDKAWSEPVRVTATDKPNSYLIRNRKFLAPIPMPSTSTHNVGEGSLAADREHSGETMEQAQATNSECLPVPPEPPEPKESNKESVTERGEKRKNDIREEVITRSGRISQPVQRYGYQP